MRLIDADKFKGFIKTVPATYTRTEGYIYLNGCRKILEIIDAAPTIDPESLRTTAHWITDSSGSTNAVCSACNAISFAAYNFCPHCGKRMVNADD